MLVTQDDVYLFSLTSSQLFFSVKYSSGLKFGVSTGQTNVETYMVPFPTDSCLCGLVLGFHVNLGQ